MFEVHVLYDGYSTILEDGSMKANCSCTLIKASVNVIVDTMTAWDSNLIIQALNRHNITPEEIDFVVCTHGHADHIGNNNLFLNAQHIVGTCVHKGDKFFTSKFGDATQSAYEITPTIRVIETPGHTADSVTVLAKDDISAQSTCYAITGDLFEKEEDILNPSIWKDLGTKELQKLQSQWRSYVINSANFIIPGHGPMFRVTGEMKKTVMGQMKD